MKESKKRVGIVISIVLGMLLLNSDVIADCLQCDGINLCNQDWCCGFADGKCPAKFGDWDYMACPWIGDEGFETGNYLQGICYTDDYDCCTQDGYFWLEGGWSGDPTNSCCGDLELDGSTKDFFNYRRDSQDFGSGCDDIYSEGCIGGDVPSDEACCSGSEQCVYNTICYEGSSLPYIAHDFDGDNFADANCLADGKWLDCDFDASACEACYANCPTCHADLPLCEDTECFVSSGEVGFVQYPQFGEYDEGSSNRECCGDDAGENYGYRVSGSTRAIPSSDDYPSFGTDKVDNACCDSSSDCIYNNICYISNEANNPLGFYDETIIPGEKLICEDIGNGLGGIWFDCDNSLGACTEAEATGRCGILDGWVPAGEGNVGEYSDFGTNPGKEECCGDDSAESKVLCGVSLGSGKKCMPVFTTACCDAPSDCVYDSSCFSEAVVGDGSCDGCADTSDSSSDLEVCYQNSLWYDADEAEGVCDEIGEEVTTMWVGSLNDIPCSADAGWGIDGVCSDYEKDYTFYCCGDDDNEYYQQRYCLNGDACVSDPTDDVCCGMGQSCVYSNLCYDGNTLNAQQPEFNPGHDLDANSIPDRVCVSATSTWYDCDFSADACSQCDWADNYNLGDNFLDCDGTACYVLSGDGLIGEYDNLLSLECCGDDAGEYLQDCDLNNGLDVDCSGGGEIGYDGGGIACCNDPDDCVWNGVCHTGFKDGGIETSDGGTCNDGYDNDCDGLTDCEDSDCSSQWDGSSRNDGKGNHCCGKPGCSGPAGCSSIANQYDCINSPLGCSWGLADDTICTATETCVIESEQGLICDNMCDGTTSTELEAFAAAMGNSNVVYDYVDANDCAGVESDSLCYGRCLLAGFYPYYTDPTSIPDPDQICPYQACFTGCSGVSFEEYEEKVVSPGCYY